MQPVRTAVIAAAGYGTRFLPVSKVVPKELLPIIDKPVIQFSVEQAREAGIERIIVVTSRGKTALEDFFDVNPDLERSLEARGSAYLDVVREVSRMAQVIAVRQPAPLGLGHAVLMAKHAVGNEPFVVYLPDEVLIGEPSATRQLLEAYERNGGSTLGVVEVPREQVSRFGIVDGTPATERDLRLTHVVEKPSIEDAPTNLGITGPYVLTPAVFDALEAITPGAGGELQLTDAVALLAEREPVFAHRYDAARYDCGTPLGLLKASVELALQRGDVAGDVRAWLKALAARQQ